MRRTAGSRESAVLFLDLSGSESLERDLDEAGEGCDVVAALEDGGHSRRELGTAARELAEPVVGHTLVDEVEVFFSMGVEAC